MSLYNAQTVCRAFAIALTAVGFLFSNDAFAQQAKVVKVQGRRAIVQFPDDARPRVGQVIDLTAGGTSISGGGSGSTGDRSMIIGGSAELSNLTQSGASSSTTVFAVDARYGWNDGIMEYGALGALTYISLTGASRRNISAGGFFDYNLVPNTPGTELVYGGAALGKFGQISSTSGTAEISGTLMTIEVGGQLKWFPLGNTVAIRGDVLYRMESVSDTVKALASGSGLVAKAGLYVYF